MNDRYCCDAYNMSSEDKQVMFLLSLIMVDDLMKNHVNICVKNLGHAFHNIF